MENRNIKKWKKFSESIQTIADEANNRFNGPVSKNEIGFMLDITFRSLFGEDYLEKKIPPRSIPKTLELFVMNIGSGYLCGETFENALFNLPKLKLREVGYSSNKKKTSAKKISDEHNSVEFGVDLYWKSNSCSDSETVRKYTVRDKTLLIIYKNNAANKLSVAKSKGYNFDMIHAIMEKYKEYYNAKYGTSFDIYMGRMISM